MKPLSNHLSEGVALFNRGEYFAAHEELEDAWREAPAQEKQFLQGLTQAAVGMHHYSKGNQVGARGVLARSIRNLEPFTPRHMDINLAALLDSLRLWLSSTDGTEPPGSAPMIERT